MTSAADRIKGRQLEILQRLADGQKRDAIAADLGISRSSLNQYLCRLYHRLHAHTAAQALGNFIKLRHPEFTL